MKLHLALVSLLIACMGFGALSLQRTDKRTRIVARCFAALGVVVSFIAMCLYVQKGDSVQNIDTWVVVQGVWAIHLGLDGTSSTLLTLAYVIYAALTMAAPHSYVTRKALQAGALTMVGVVGVLCAWDLVTFAVAWFLTALPLYLSARRQRRTQGTYAIGSLNLAFWGSVLPLIGAVVIIAVAHGGDGTHYPLSLQLDDSKPIALSWQYVAFYLLAVSAFIRAAVIPFHASLPRVVQHGPFISGTLLAGTQLGLVLFIRLGAHVLPTASYECLPFVGWLGLYSTVLAALVATAQKDLRQIVAYIIISQSGLAMVGVASLNEQGVAGALLQSVTTGLGAVGLMLLSWSLADRTATTDVTRLGGLVKQSPRFAALWFTLGIVTIGLPGTLGFIAEDLLVQGILGQHPVLALLFILATALNAIAFLRGFYRAFLGPPGRVELGALPVSVHDLVFRERVVALVLIALVIGGGLYPQPLLDHISGTVETIVRLSR